MKFRGKMFDPVSMRRFYNILGTLSKFSKSCVMRLTKEKIFFILTEEANLGALGATPSVWAELPVSRFFAEYTMEGVSDENPEIYIELDPERLTKALSALKSNSQAKSLKVKLTRKHQVPCLSFEMEFTPGLTSSSGLVSAGLSTLNTTRSVIHDVQVALVPRKHWNEFKEPELPSSEVSLLLPDIKQLKHLLERYKNLASHMEVKANRRGMMTFSLETDQVNVITHFRDLEVPSYNNAVITNLSNVTGVNMETQESNNSDDNQSASARVDLKRVVAFCSVEQVHPKFVVLSINDKKLLHLSVAHDDLSMQYYIPGSL